MKHEFDELAICPVCFGELRAVKKSLFCKNCNRRYLVQNDILLLVEDVNRLTSEIASAKERRPGWYESDQLEYELKSPYRHNLKKRTAFLRKTVSKLATDKKKKVLMDAGCGDGVNLKNLIDLPNITFFGVDYNITRLERAKKAIKDNKVRLVLADLTVNSFKSNSVDIILCNHVLEHIPDDRKVLHNFYLYLKPEGTLILGVPQEGAFLWKLRNNFIQPSIRRKTDHVHFYTIEEVKEKLLEERFKVMQINLLGWGLPHTFIDAKVRQFKKLDDLMDVVGKNLFRSQAMGLYFIAKK